MRYYWAFVDGVVDSLISDAGEQADRWPELTKEIDDVPTELRPHRALGRRTPRSVYETKMKAAPQRRPAVQFRVRYDHVDGKGQSRCATTRSCCTSEWATLTIAGDWCCSSRTATSACSATTGSCSAAS